MSTYGTWKGTPREQIPWYPTVDQDEVRGLPHVLRVLQPWGIQLGPGNQHTEGARTLSVRRGV